MPSIMTLDGPRLRRIDQIRGELYSMAPRPMWRAQSQLSGLFDTIKPYRPLLFLASIVGGAIYAGYKRKR